MYFLYIFKIHFEHLCRALYIQKIIFVLISKHCYLLRRISQCTYTSYNSDLVNDKCLKFSNFILKYNSPKVLHKLQKFNKLL